MFLSVSLAPATDVNKLLEDGEPPYEGPFAIISENPPTKKIDASKKRLVQDGMTLGSLVAILGKGWEGRWDNVGIISWQFDDGSNLLLSLGKPLKPETRLTFNHSENGANIRWQSK